MACYIVSYDLKGDDYEGLYKALKSYGTWGKITESTWAVVSEDTAVQIRDYLGPYLPKGSRLFVVKSGAVAAWKNVKADSEWLKKHL